jgi:hypothetical protein
VHGASAEDRSTGVLDTQQLGALRRVQADIKGAVARVPGGVLELEVPRGIVRVLHPEVPARRLVVGRLVEVGNVGIGRVLALVPACLDQER